jgi:hypothetical protein
MSSLGLDPNCRAVCGCRGRPGVVTLGDLSVSLLTRAEGFGIDEVMKGWSRQGVSHQELMDRGMQLADGIYQSLIN